MKNETPIEDDYYQHGDETPKMTHTKLPWSAEHYGGWSSFASDDHLAEYFMRLEYGENDLSTSLEEGMANAEYIVKACNAYPELVRACKTLTGAFPSDDYDNMDAAEFVDNSSDTIDAVEIAKAVLKKVGEL